MACQCPRKTEQAKTGEKREQEESEEEYKEQGKGNEDEDSRSSVSKTNLPMKPPIKATNKEKEGTADNGDPFPRKVDAHQMVCKPAECPPKGAVDERCSERLASQRDQAAGDFGTPQTCERQAM